MKTKYILLGILIASTLTLLTGCSGNLIKDAKNKGSISSMIPNTNGLTVATIKQGDNPAQKTTQDVQQERSVTIDAPAGASIKIDDIEVKAQAPTITTNYTPVVTTNITPTETNKVTNYLISTQCIQATQAIHIKITGGTHNNTVMGASQKNTAEDLAIKLQSAKPTQAMGYVLIFVALGLVVARYWIPIIPLRVAGYSAIAGFGLVFLAPIFAANDKIIIIVLISIGALVGLYEFITHSATLKVKLQTIEESLITPETK